MTVQLEFRLSGEVLVRLFDITARKFIGLAILLFFTIPFGLSVTGCGHKAAAVVYCSSGDTGPVAGQLATIQLEPSLAIVGESLNYGQIGSGLSATGYDCKGAVVSTSRITYGTTDATIADINPSNGQACGGTWNRNTGGGVQDYTTCNPPAGTPSNYLAYITATADGISSNALPIYVHPLVSSVVFGKTTGCSMDPDTTCCPTSPTTVVTAPYYDGTSCLSQGSIGQLAARIVSDTAPSNYAVTGITVSTNSTTFTISGSTPPPTERVVTLSGFTSGTVPNTNPVQTVPLTALNGQSIVVQSNQGGGSSSSFTVPSNFNLTPNVLTATGTSTTTSNITCTAGNIRFGTQGAANIVSIDQNGVVTADLPGSVAITGQLSNSSSANSIGFFSTCPPVSISLSAVGQTGTSITVPINNTQPITASAVDKTHHQITGLLLEYNSTTPQTIPGGDTIVPTFPGTAVITAVCQPPTCNPAPFSQTGYLGNGKPVTSTDITVTATGNSSTLLYIGSTSSQYLQPIDFTTNTTSGILKLPYVPNSMVLSQDGSRLYLGSSSGLMTLTTSSNQLGATNTLIPGTVISVSPSGGDVVVTDPLRQTISLVTTGGSVATSFGGVATHAAWSPDSQTVYITTTGNNILTYSLNTNWQSTLIATTTPTVNPSQDTVYNDVTVLDPSVGAYFAGSISTDGRSYCPYSANQGGGTPPTEANIFSPLADVTAAHIDRIATTTDGKHALGASLTTGVSDIFLTSIPGDCTTVDTGTERSAVKFGSATRALAFAGITPSLITGVLPSSNSDIAFVTYTGTGGKLPYYLPVATGNTGTLNYFSLTGGAIAPVAGVFSSDDSTFFVGTSGDNKVHLLTITYPAGGGAPVITDSSQITPALPDVNNTTTVTPNLIAQHPKATKS